MPLNVFADDWRECLRAHYMHVIRTRDKVTEPSLTVVMRNAGFNDSELAELRVRATLHVDDVPADFVPDLDILNAAPPHDHAPHIFPVAVDLATAGEVVPVAEAEGELLIVEGEIEDALELDDQAESVDDVETDAPLIEDEPDEDEPQQLSLF